MKTIEEKAKAYDEALERAKVAHKDTDRHIKATIERIFPDLKESEDERIRKKLIGIFTNQSLCDVYNLKSEEVIAYLEKQKECVADSNKTSADEDEKIRKAIRLILIATEDEQKDFYSTHGLTRKNCTDWLEKQKEQKPVEVEQNPLARMLKDKKAITEDIRNGIPTKTIEKERNVKFATPVDVSHTEWSEEDEKMISSIIMFLAAFMGNEEKIDFLKSLRPQPKPEWSEEDKENLLCVCGLLKHYLSANYKGSKYWVDAQVKEWIKWAEDLPIRFNLSQKQEWSEEEHRMLDSIEKIIYCCIEDEPVTFPKEYLKDFAFFIHTTQKKCPCPKPSWKPSKEQMEALKFAIDKWKNGQGVVCPSSFRYENLSHLYNALKKNYKP